MPAIPLHRRNVRGDIDALATYFGAYSEGGGLDETTANGYYVRLDGTNEASWIPNPAPGDATQDITGHFNLAGVYSYKIGDTEVLQTWGTQNVAIGHGFDASAGAGRYSVFIGDGAGVSSTSAWGNIFIGVDSGHSNDLDQNIFIGNEAGYYNTGDSNVFIGTASGYGADGLSNGVHNTFVGFDSGANLTSGDSNVITGYQAGLTLTTGEKNVIIGSGADGLADIDEAVVIGYMAGAGSYIFDDVVIVGSQASMNTYSQSAVVIGKDAGMHAVFAGGENIFFSVIIGESAGEEPEDIEQSEVIGYFAGSNNANVFYSTVIGEGAGANNTYIYDSVAIGLGAAAGGADLSECVAIGEVAADELIYGYESIMIGAGAGIAGISIEDSILIGWYAGLELTSDYVIGVGNCILYEAVTYRSIYIGDFIGGDLNNGMYNWGFIDGDDNVNIGYRAGQGSTHEQNVIIGSSAAGYNWSAAAELDLDGEIFIGYRAGRYETQNNRLHIGYETPWLYGELDTPKATFFADLDVYDGGTLGTETLTESDFATHANWDVTGDFSDAGGNAAYTHSTGHAVPSAGTLTQTSGNFAVAAVANAWYAFTYTIVADELWMSVNGINAVITNAFAAEEVRLELLNSGTYTVYFKSAAVPGNFIISVVSLYNNQDFTIDDVSLKQITGGDLYVNGTATMQGGVINNVTHIDDGDNPYTALSSDEVVFCDTDGGAITVNLPAGVEGTHYKIINCGTSGSDITVDGNSTELVYGELTQTLRDGDVLDLNFSAVQGWY